MKLKSILIAIAFLIVSLIPTSLYAQEKDLKSLTAIQYRTHVQDEGWQSWRNNGELSGTTGQGKRVEAIEIKSDNASIESELKYRVHIQDEGWQSWKSSGELAGTVGKSKRIEAIEIKIGNNSEYSIKYRAHVQDEGWQSWRNNGELAGTTGQVKRIEAIEIDIESVSPPDITYQAHVQDEGWQSWRSNGELAGTTGQSKRVEALRLELKNTIGIENLKYRVHVQDEGWQSWKSNGELAGTIGQSKRIEAIEIKLENREGYEAQYRAHVQYEGWQPWKSNGELAGTTGQGKRVEAVEIRIGKVGELPPTNPEEIVKIMYTIPESLNVRTGPGTSYDKIGTLSKGSKVEVVEELNGWSKIKFNDGYGYVSTGYLTETPEEAVKIMYTTPESLNVRIGPGTSYDKIGTLSKGSKVEVVEESDGWSKIKFNDGYGYVSTSYLTETPEESVKIMYTTPESLNVRTGPGTSYDKIGTLSKGSKVEVVEESDGWSKIKFNDGYGYVSTNYLSESSDVGSGQQPLPVPSHTPSYVDSPQNPEIIDSSQDIYQNKINVNKKNIDGLKGLAIGTNGDFNINYQLYSDGSWKYGENGQEVDCGQMPVEGIKIKIGQEPENYHIFYRTKIKNQGWQAWVKDGYISGELGSGKNIEDLEVRVVVSNRSDAMVKPTLAIDTGHNVSLSGAINGIYSESYLTKTVSEKVIYKLRSMGYNVVDTLPVGEHTQAQELEKRTQVAKLNEVEKFVSIHFNSGPEGANGSEVYYSLEPGSSQMATNVLNNIVSEFGFRNRDIKEGDHLYVLRNTNMPAILVEGCFLDNIDMNKFISKGSSAYDIMADSIIRGII